MRGLSALILCCLLICVSAVSKIDIKDEKTNATCISGQTDLSLFFTYTKSDKSKANVTIPLSAAKDVKLSGTCGNETVSSILNADFKVDGKAWKATWTFTRSKDTITLSHLALKYVSDNKLFPNTTFQGNVSTESQPNVTLAEYGNKFQCHSGVNLDAKGGVVFEQLEFEIEPFVADGKPSKKVTLCPGDVTPTTTAHPNTTTAQQNTTTAQPTTTAPVTTPPPTPTPQIAKYQVKDKAGNICLMADLGIIFRLSEKEEPYSVVNATVDKSSQCAEHLNETATLVLKFDQTSNLTMTFKSNSDKMAVMDSVTLFYDQKKVLNKTKGMKEETGKLNLVLSSVTKHYQCNQTLLERLTKTALVAFSDVKIQVFNVNNSFASEYDECIQDKPLPTDPASGNYSVKAKDGVYCVVAHMGIRFSIPYTKSNGKSANLTLDLPVNATTTTGTCGNKTQAMTLSFFNDWKLEFLFGKDSNKKNALTNLTLYYTYNDMFVDADPKIIGQAQTTANNTLDAFPVQDNQVYKCVKVNSTLVLDKVVLNVTDLYIESFRDAKDTKFSSTVIECNADNKTNSIVPIAVGAALAGLVVIVLIAYLIGRRRSHKGYQSV